MMFVVSAVARLVSEPRRASTTSTKSSQEYSTS